MLAQLMDRIGQTKVPLYAKEAAGFRGFVARTGEFRRIEALPRRIWDTEPGLSNVVDLLTNELKTEYGTMKLWKVQAAALRDMVYERGAFLPIGVGQGKALISLLAPVVLDAKRAVLLVPAQLREQTIQYVIPEMRKHWELPPSIAILGYSELSLEKNAYILDDLEPDLIILDECHRVKNKRAGRTRRLVRYFKDHPETMCVAMSGTISNRSLKDFAHIAEWCLKDRVPLPRRWTELTEWALAIDEKIPDGQQYGPGALAKFCKDGENVRQGFRQRLVETSGVVATKENMLGTSLRIERFRGLEVPEKIYKMINDMRNTWTTPNGDIITEVVDLWRHVRELALGFFYKWDPPAPKDWMKARKAWKSYVRETLKHNRRNLDTELQVWNECEREKEFIAWKAIKDTFKPNSVAEWINDFALKGCRGWLEYIESKTEGGICWVEHRAFGQQLAHHSGYKYFGAGDSAILDTKQTAIIASIAAHGEGKNLQRYSKNLVVAPMTSGKKWEQCLGRTHREGQQADEVKCVVFLHMPELEASFKQAQADAVYLEDTFGNRQKLNYADVVM